MRCSLQEHHPPHFFVPPVVSYLGILAVEATLPPLSGEMYRGRYQLASRLIKYEAPLMTREGFHQTYQVLL